ncbi:hypothetical protein SRHO_G00087250 [Serrasalmus rhombeus]
MVKTFSSTPPAPFWFLVLPRTGLRFSLVCLWARGLRVLACMNGVGQKKLSGLSHCRADVFLTSISNAAENRIARAVFGSVLHSEMPLYVRGQVQFGQGLIEGFSSLIAELRLSQHAMLWNCISCLIRVKGKRRWQRH